MINQMILVLAAFIFFISPAVHADTSRRVEYDMRFCSKNYLPKDYSYLKSYPKIAEKEATELIEKDPTVKGILEEYPHLYLVRLFGPHTDDDGKTWAPWIFEIIHFLKSDWTRIEYVFEVDAMTGKVKNQNVKPYILPFYHEGG